MNETTGRWAMVLGLAVAAGAAQADAMSDSQCEQIRDWVAGVAPGPHQTDQLLHPGYFSKHFGRPYEQLTIAELRQLDIATNYNCRQVGNMTPQQLKTANDLLSERAQQRWVAMPGHGGGAPAAGGEDRTASLKRSWQDKLASKAGLKHDAPTAAPAAPAAVPAAPTAAPAAPAAAPAAAVAVAAAPAAAPVTATAAPAAAPTASEAKKSWKDKLKELASQAK